MLQVYALPSRKALLFLSHSPVLMFPSLEITCSHNILLSGPSLRHHWCRSPSTTWYCDAPATLRSGCPKEDETHLVSAGPCGISTIQNGPSQTFARRNLKLASPQWKRRGERDKARNTTWISASGRQGPQGRLWGPAYSVVM